MADKTNNKMKQLTQEQLEQIYREHPEWRTEIEVGKWYHYESYLLCYTGADDKLMRAYGFDEDMQWVEENIFWLCPEKWNQAHPEEVSSALIAEARKRGFKSGVEINNSALGFRDNWQKIEGGNIDWGGEYLYFGNRGAAIFYNGKWADVREAKPNIEVGKWYKVKDHKTLFFVTNIATIVTADGFGFNSLGFWCNDGLWSTAHVVEAKPFEVEAALIAEARKRGFKSNQIKMIGDTLVVGVGDKWKVIFIDGKWADVREVATTVEVGKWYKNPMSENLFCPTSEVKDGHVSAFGFTGSGARWWSDDGKYEWCVLDVVEATHEEVEAALIAEAKRRYRDGDKVDRFAGRYLGEGNSMVIQRVEDSFMESDGSIWVDSDSDFSICLFTDGKWATVITPASTLASDIQALKDKYPNYNWTIIAESK